MTTYIDHKNRTPISLLTNDMDSNPTEIIESCHQRWEIEQLFKQMEPNFHLKYFYGESANAVKIQIWDIECWVVFCACWVVNEYKKMKNNGILWRNNGSAVWLLMNLLLYL